MQKEKNIEKFDNSSNSNVTNPSLTIGGFDLFSLCSSIKMCGMPVCQLCCICCFYFCYIICCFGSIAALLYSYKKIKKISDD